MSDSRDEWLAWRRGGIGASDVAAIVGLSPWASPYTVWLDKVEGAGDDDSEAMEAGRMLEPAIGPWFTQRTGLYVLGEQTWCTHIQYPWALATVDGFVAESPESDLDAVLGGLEVKTTSDSPARWADDGIPAHYQAQAQWQMFVTATERTWFAVLHAAFGLKLRVYELERDETDIEFLVDHCMTFWIDHVLAGVPPDVDGHPATTEALKARPVDAGAEVVDLDAAGLTAHLADLARIKADLKVLEADRGACENAIRQALGPATEGRSALASVTHREQTTTRVDAKALRARLPRVADRFSTTSTTRVLRVTPTKTTKKEIA